MLRASIVMLTSGVAGLFFGSGIAWLLSGELELFFAPPPHVEPAHHPNVHPADVIQGGLFAPAPDDPPTPPLPPGEGAPACDGSMRLVGVAVVHRDPRRAYAAIHTAGEQWLAGPGSPVGEHTLVRVEPQSVVLAGPDGAWCELRLFDPRPAPIAQPPAVRPSPADAVRQVGAHAFELDRAAVMSAGRRSRVRPIPMADGSVRLFGIRAGGPEHAAGLRNGDTIVAVDGQPASPDVALAAYARGMAGQPVRLTIERRGERLEHTYRLAGGP